MMDKKKAPLKVALISYNTFLPSRQNGWKSGNAEVLLIQNPHNREQGFTRVGDPSEWYGQAERVFGRYWQQLQADLPTLDLVVLYVGGCGAEHFIEFIARENVAPDRVTFVFCDCNKNEKEGYLRVHGFSSSRVIPCECGGNRTMERLYDFLLTNGDLPDD